jgi:hypothetical protein
MIMARIEKNHTPKLPSLLNNPKLTPRFQVSTKLKKDVTGMTFGGSITSTSIHHLLA